MEVTTRYNKGDNFKTYLPFIADRLPAEYQEKYPDLVAFLEAYYEWLEQDKNATDRLMSYELFKDSDYGANEFIENFRSELMPFFPASVVVDKSLLIKNINEFYRSKGKPKALEFLFRVLFDETPGIEYPVDRIIFQEQNQNSTDVIMRLNYIDSPATSNVPFTNFIGKKIKGNTSGAQAFVINASQNQINSTIFVELTLSNITVSPTFVSDELIVTQETTPLIGRVYGLVSDTNITNGGTGYELNSSVIFASQGDGSGVSAVISRVTGGLSRVEITDGGAGYDETDTLVIDIDPVTPPGVGSGATAHAIISAGRVAFIVVDTAGTGYTDGVTISISGGTPTRPAKARGFTSGAITAIRFADPGIDYHTVAPVADFSFGGSGAVATFDIGPIATVIPRVIRYRAGNNSFPSQNYNVLLILGGGSGSFSPTDVIYQGNSLIDATWTGVVVDWILDERRLIIEKNLMTGFDPDALIKQDSPAASWSYDSPYSNPIRLDAGDDEINREYTYNIKSIVPVANYSQYVKDNVHPAGMRFFGLFELIGDIANISTLFSAVLFKGTDINALNDAGYPKFLNKEIEFGWRHTYPMNRFNHIFGKISDISSTTFQDMVDQGTVKNLTLKITGEVTVETLGAVYLTDVYQPDIYG